MDVELSLRLWDVYELGKDVDGNENVKIANKHENGVFRLRIIVRQA